MRMLLHQLRSELDDPLLLDQFDSPPVDLDVSKERSYGRRSSKRAGWRVPMSADSKCRVRTST
jgi:hypothetical protein